MTPTDGESTSTVDFSLMVRQVMLMNTTNKIAMMSANHLKPLRSSPAPNAYTHFMVMMVTIAEPTPAQERPSVDNPSRSFPPSVNAGIIDQNGISIMVYVTPQRI